jgi:hypothetical protein
LRRVETFILSSLLASLAPAVGSGQVAKNGRYVTGKDYPQAPAYESQREAAFWISGPTAPGESVLITGAFNNLPKSVRLAPVKAGAAHWRAELGKSSVSVPGSLLGSTGLVFTLPKTFPAGPFAFKVEDRSTPGLTEQGNVPDVFWTNGLPRDLAAPAGQVQVDGVERGGSLRIFGRCFSTRDKALLMDDHGKRTTLSAVAATPYALTFSVSSTLQPGKYVLRVGEGNTPDGTSSRPTTISIQQASSISVRTIDLASCGVKGDGATDNAANIQHCLDSNSSGAPISFRLAAGKFVISTGLQLHPHQYLLGVSEQATSVIGKPSSAPPQSWVTGQNYFGLRDLTITAPVRTSVVSSDLSGDPQKSGHILLDHVSIDVLDPDYSNRKAQNIALSGPDIRILNCSLNHGVNLALYIQMGTGVFIAGTHVNWANNGWYHLQNCKNVIVEHNFLDGVGGGYGSHHPGTSQNIYTAYNSYQAVEADTREAFTTDGGGGAYAGRVISTTSGKMVLAGAPDMSWMGSYRQDLVVTIIAGCGLGQYRMVRAITGREVELVSPWTVPPNQESIVSITPLSRHLIFYNNTFKDTGPGVQFYGMTFDSVIAQNTFEQSEGVFLRGQVYFGGYLPLLNVEVINNRFNGDARSTNLQGQPKPSTSGIHLFSPDESSLVGILIRNNTIAPPGKVELGGDLFRMCAVLMENNTVPNLTEVAQKAKLNHSILRISN